MKTTFLAILTVAASSAGAQLIEFDVPNQNIPYSESGFEFTSLFGGGNLFTTRAIDSGELLLAVGDGNAGIRMSRIGGGTFDVRSLDYSYFGVDTGSIEWAIVNNNGSVIRLDLLAASSDTLILNWSGVESIQFEVSEDLANEAGSVLRIDNILIVPEPASAALLGLGGVALLRRRRRDWSDGARIR